jgi:hypothetical protein
MDPDPDPGGSKTYGSATLVKTRLEDPDSGSKQKSKYRAPKTSKGYLFDMIVFEIRGPPPGNAGEEPVDQLSVLLSAQLLKSEPHAAFPNLYKWTSTTKLRNAAKKQEVFCANPILDFSCLRIHFRSRQ